MKAETIIISAEDTQVLLEKYADKKVTFIFGAGASAGYTNLDNAFIPPVVKDLFDPEKNAAVRLTLQDKAHASIAGSLPAYQRGIEKNGYDLEAYLSKAYARNHRDTRFADIMNYLQDIFFRVSINFVRTENNYMALFEQIAEMTDSKTWSFITFNYDTILEQSYLAVCRERERKIGGFPSIESYYAIPPIFLKMHGSINWRYIMTKRYEPSDESGHTYSVYGMFDFMMGVDEPDRTKIMSISAKTLKSEESWPIFHDTSTKEQIGPNTVRRLSIFNIPIMLIPIHGQMLPENNFFPAMIEKAKNEIQQSDLIVSIGYNFGDETFMSKMSDVDFSSKTLLLVTAEALDNVEHLLAVQNIRRFWKSVHISVFEGSGFRAFVEAIRA